MSKLQLVSNWRKMHKSWTIILSVIFAIANLVMGGLFILTPFFDVKTFAALNFFFYMLVGVGRIFKQESLEYVSPPSQYEIMPYAQSQTEEKRASQFDNPDLS